MKQELQEELFALAPEWFRRGDLRQSLMAFGFEVGDGWYQLLKDLILGLKKLDLPEDFEIVQVKEKFGTLRFYVSSHLEAVEELISTAENASETTCEDCGQPGELGGKGWVQTLCTTCREKG